MTTSYEKSFEMKTNILSSKQTGSGSGASTHRSLQKVPLGEHKENKSDKTNIPLMNIMMKKLAEQKTYSKKV